MKKRTVRVGVVGVGTIAQINHIPGYMRRCENVEIAALCDIDEEQLKSVGQTYDVSNLTTEYQELVQMRELDAVDICTWPDMHHPVAMAAIAQGKHVFCEKPLALNYRLAREMYEAAKTAGVATATGFTHRVTPAARLAHRIISSGDLGDIYHVIAIYAAGSADCSDRPKTARQTKAVTGGWPVPELGPHMADMVRWWLGEEITSVCAHNQTFVKHRPSADSGELLEMDVEDGSAWLATFEGGGMGVFVTSFAFTARGFTQTVEVYGSNGAIMYDQGRPYELRACVGPEMMKLCSGWDLYSTGWGVFREEEPYPVIKAPAEFMVDRPLPWERPPTQTLTPYFVAAVRGEEVPLLPTFYEGMKAQEVLDAVYISDEERRWVDLPLPTV